MSFKCIEPEKLYARDPNLKKEDVTILQEWLRKQPHLPKIQESQILLFLHSCYYKIEAAKITIDNYFTERSACSEIYVALMPDVLKATAAVAYIGLLPNKTPDGFRVLFLKLLDLKTENFNCSNLINLVNMVSSLFLHQNGFDNGAVALFDMKGFTLGHLTRLNLNVIKHVLYHIQEGIPVRIKQIHVMNAIPLADKVVALLKPFLKPELYNMLEFHPPGSDSLYKSVPKECLPEEYGGKAATSQVLNDKNLENLLDNYDFFKWHDAQAVDEAKRIGKPKNPNENFGIEGTFKKLAID